jgi:DNA-binding NarL/FixJ family response regulator
MPSTRVTAASGREAIQQVLTQSYDVIILDVRMPVMDGLQAAREIAHKTKVKPLILTTFDDDEAIFKALECGAKGYLLKNSSPSRIMDAITAVHSGGTVMQDIVMDRIREGLTSAKKAAIGFPEEDFTDRELDIIRLVAKGFSNREIAGDLFMSEGTVKNYITAILGKTGLEHRTQIAVYFLTGEKC